mmetsp:Transcript_39451/g.113379  ORF Transcript_39451/g.113379 Transcript_39451/m.113379 type:complete len:301 (+) Transcript_39451:150-1052(+)
MSASSRLSSSGTSRPRATGTPTLARVWHCALTRGSTWAPTAARPRTCEHQLEASLEERPRSSPPRLGGDALPCAVVQLGPVRQVGRLLACNDEFRAVVLLLSLVTLRVRRDLLLCLRRRLEDLLQPTGLPGVDEIVDLELQTHGIDILFVAVFPLLKVLQAPAHLGDRLFAAALRVALQRVADGVEQLADALDLVLGGKLVDFSAHRKIPDDAADDACAQQASQEQVADELHRCEAAALLLAHQEVQLLLVQALLLFIRHVNRLHGDPLELGLANCEQRALEGDGLPAIRRRELRHLALQ